MALSETLHVFGAEGGVVAASPLRDVVVEACNIEELGFGDLAHALLGYGVALLGAVVKKAPEVPQEQHCVSVYGVDVEKVMLHLANDAAEFGQVATENPVTPHARQLGDQPMGASKQRHEASAVFRIGPKGVIDKVEALADHADRGGPDAIDVLAVGEDDEELEKGPGSGFEDVLAAGGQGTALNLEVLVDDLPGLGGRRRNDGLVEVLKDEVVQLPEREHMDVVIVHETLNGELAATVFVSKEGSELPLVVKAELLFSALCQQV